MSVNIDKAYIDYSTSIKVTIDTSKFGPRQIKAFHRMLKTGVIEGLGPPSRIAYRLRKTRGLSVVYFNKHSGITWHNVPADSGDFFDGLTAGVLARRMQYVPQEYHKYTRDYELEALNEADEVIQRRDSSGRIWHIADEVKSYIKKASMSPYDGPVDTLIEIEMLDEEWL